MSRPARLALATMILAGLTLASASCTRSDAIAREGGFDPGPIAKRVLVWADAEGTYTCPPEGMILTSDPSQCSAEVEDRVRLRGDAIHDVGNTLETAPDYAQASVQIKGNVDPSGFGIDVADARVIELNCGYSIAPQPDSPCRSSP